MGKENVGGGGGGKRSGREKRERWPRDERETEAKVVERKVDGDVSGGNRKMLIYIGRTPIRQARSIKIKRPGRRL